MITRKRTALNRHIQFFDLYRIHSHFVCQFIYSRFYRKNTLGSTISTICSGCLYIGIDYIKSKTVCFCMSVKCNGFMSAQSYCCRTVFAISPCIGQCININCLDDSIFICSCTYCDLHLMTWSRTDHGFISGIDHFGWTSGLPGNNCRIYLTYR